MPRLISVVVPIRGEAPPDAEVLARLRGPGVEVIVAAERATVAETLRAWEAAGARLLVEDGPRGARLKAAAALATGDVVLFLHADTQLPERWRDAVESAIAGGAVAGAFRLGFSGGGTRMAWVAGWANLRTSFTRVPYGDQAPFVRRDLYERLSGHRPWPLLEDVDLFERLRREGRVALLQDRVLTSPRRYLARGVGATVLLNWRILWRYHRGVSPEVLAGDYRGR